ncbi:SDR family oxidoreductase [Aequorivita lipolytica]|uniref:SDR family oxidoreductase n=1 Tax=Aequorivita lipolytica TaxID=153267 RepID=A0A5C6YPZ9_9FLAO|nr:SDR family oxidoreductase [Aequorivita lipolytica]TXD69096.1 SDR family oxidoreductase [Aequorivita lipolytica]SRX51334.1 2-dehydro-3-deoxy-D-gluconate 5-dehydrogenase [Aequorivita lipolytica]
MKKKTILITGAGSGLGKGTAVGLAKKGHQVIAAVHTWEQMSRFITDLENTDYKKNIELIKLDIRDMMDCEKAWDFEIDILVNNAGIGQTGPMAEIPVDLIREVMETNAFSTLEFSQPIIRKMVERGNGKVVFLSSVAGLVTNAYLGPYNASKHALEAIVQCLRDELKPLGVTVATINPGPFETGFNDRMYDTYQQWFDEDLHFTPLKDIEKAAKGMANNQLDPQEMIDKMVEIIPMESHDFRTVFPEKLAEKCQEYQKRQYDIKTDTVDKSKK